MGCIASKQDYITSANGNERDYQERFLESKTLGQGEFGVVKLVHDVKSKDLIGSKPLAVKYLKKGYQFKDNTIYSPMKKEVLQGEVEILRRLNGECYCLKLVAVYETPSQIMMVSEFCEGGEMMTFVTSAFNQSNGAEGLRTEDVSRISYQLFSAVDHCAKHGVIHRDIKPENVMFCTSKKDSELRLIDFGSGTLDDMEVNPANTDGEVERHHTFAGSAFYISPEMFLRTYTSKTDVWSAGATLYVLVAGYPADKLQEAFNVLQSANKSTDPQEPGKRLRKLPNLPDNLPDSFYQMLEGALTYGHKARLSAGELMKGEFPQFHIHHADESGAISIHDVVAEAGGETEDKVGSLVAPTLKKTSSVLLDGSVRRHNAYLGYQKFERSVTTILATMLPKDALRKLLITLKEMRSNANSVAKSEGISEEKKECAVEVDTSGHISVENASKLQIVTVSVLLEVVRGLNIEETAEVIRMIENLQNFKFYESFAYHVSLLRQFVSMRSRGGNDGGDDGGFDTSVRSAVSFASRNRNSVHGNNVWNALKSKRGLADVLNTSNHSNNNDFSVRSASGRMGMRRVNTAAGALSRMG